MNPTFRRRVFTPIVLPLSVVGGLLLFGMSLARVLLAVQESVSVVIAIGVAGYVLFVSAAVASQRSITSRALGLGLVLAFVGVVGAGAVATAAGMRSFEHEEEQAEVGDTGEAAAAEIPEGALVWEADTDLLYTAAPSEGPAGDVSVAIQVEGGLEHNVVFEGVMNDQPIVEAVDGVDVAEAQLDPGTYTYYCSVPGHREAGMEGEITLN